jgi:hypothetical protein
LQEVEAPVVGLDNRKVAAVKVTEAGVKGRAAVKVTVEVKVKGKVVAEGQLNLVKVKQVEILHGLALLTPAITGGSTSYLSVELSNNRM